MENTERCLSTPLGDRIIEEYSKHLELYTFLAPGSCRQYVSVIKRLTRRKKRLTDREVVKFLKKEPRGYVRQAIIHFLELIKEQDLIKEVRKLRIRKKEPRPREIPTYEEFMKVINRLGEEEKWIASFLLMSGARCHEVFRIALGDIRTNGTITMETKGGKYRMIRLPDDFLSKLMGYLKLEKGLGPGEMIFYTESKGTLETKVKRFWKKLNRRAVRIIDKNIGTHDFRRYYATYLYKKTGHNIEMIQRLLGHASMDTTMKYIKYAVKEADLDKAKELMSKLGESQDS